MEDNLQNNRKMEDIGGQMHVGPYLLVLGHVPQGSLIHVNIPFSQPKCDQLFPPWEHTGQNQIPLTTIVSTPPYFKGGDGHLRKLAIRGGISILLYKGG